MYSAFDFSSILWTQWSICSRIGVQVFFSFYNIVGDGCEWFSKVLSKLFHKVIQQSYIYK
jgi:hypothetical protein